MSLDDKIRALAERRVPAARCDRGCHKPGTIWDTRSRHAADCAVSARPAAVADAVSLIEDALLATIEGADDDADERGARALGKLRTAPGALAEDDLVPLYLHARRLAFPDADPDADAADPRARVLLLRFARERSTPAAARYLVCAVRFWRDRAAEGRWPGAAGPPALRAVLAPRMISAYGTEFGAG